MRPRTPASTYGSIQVVQQVSESTVYHRAVRNADHRHVIIKALDPRCASPIQLDRLKREYEIGRTLDLRALMKPLALETFEGMPALVVEDFGGEPLGRLLGEPLPTERFLGLAIRIVAAVADLHRQNVVHKNLNPESIFVAPDTGEVKLTDLGIASLLSRERQSARPPSLIEGSLPYLSPEQTGRMSRAVDNRSDLYSVGVLFYEMLTGALPFTAEDPLEWVHFHLARIPASPRSIVPDLPPTIERMVLKLLSKMPEERYQTALGLLRDLERASAEWKAAGRIEPFPLAQRDLSDRLQIPQGLYGRDRELARLLGDFARVVEEGTSELVLVSGYSGIGKSSLVQELRKPIAQKRSFFLSGKFEPLKRDTPYFVFVQAFRDLVLEILAENEDQIAGWRSRLSAALRGNGQLILNVIPEVELLIGPQPPVPDLPPAEAQNRFRIVFRQFIGVFTRPEQPLALFLDDLQWADTASLGLLKDLITHPEMRSLFVVGAYRDNEVFPSHPLLLTLDEARRQGAKIVHIVLRALSRDHLAAFVGDALHRPRKEIASLSELVHDKTGGNPFFAIQFLTTLYEQGLVEFDPQAGAWRWDMEKIRAKAFTDNLVEFMLEKLKSLPSSTREALKQVACLGNSADVGTLMIVSGRSEDEIHADLWEAVRANLILLAEDTYKFLHDRVQEAAYSLIPDERRAAEHLRIGRLLFPRLTEEAMKERVFEIANQFNRGIDLVTDAREKASLCRLNLLAGSKAKASIAYASARTYLDLAARLLPEDAWTAQYEQTFTLYLELSECEYLVGNFQRADELTSLILANARSSPDRTRVYGLRMRLYQVSGRLDDAVNVMFEGLRSVGIVIPESDAEIQVATLAEAQLLPARLAGRRIPDLVDSPVVTDPELRALIGVIGDALPAAYVGRPITFPLLALKSVNASLQYGNTEASCYGYTAYAIVVVSSFGDIASAVQFSEMSLKLNEKFDNAQLRGTLLFLHGNFINSWKKHVATSIPILERGFLASLEVGDLVYAGYGSINLVWDLFERGEPLPEVIKTARKYAAYAKESSNDVIYYVLRLYEQLAVNLQGLTPDPELFDDGDFSEARSLTVFTQARNGTAIAYFHISKLIAAFIYERYDDALESATHAVAAAREVMAMISDSTLHFYYALILMALYPKATAAQQEDFMRTIEPIVHKLEFWAEHGPENHANRYALASAELAQLRGEERQAMALYEQAIKSARDNGFVQNEAIAYELAARFYQTLGFEAFADTYFREARSCYSRWGATGKVKQLERRHPRSFTRETPRPPVSVAVREEQLDLISAIKASQRISGEILIDKLVCRLLEVALEQSGAQRAYLILSHAEKDLLMEAAATVEENRVRAEILPSVPVSSSALVPESVIQYVRRTKKRVILHDAAADAEQFSSEKYLTKSGARSVLALPILRQNQLIGVLYLENNAIPFAFSPERLTTLELLASQAAVSLQNAHLYQSVREENVERRRAQEALRVSRQQLQSIIDSAATVIFVKDPDGQYVLVNRKFEDVFDVKKDWVIGKTDYDVFPRETADRARTNDRKVLESKLPFEWEEVIPHKDGLHTYISIRFPLFTVEGTAYAVCGISTDITERKRAEQERERLLAQEQQARMEAQKSVKVRDDFIAVASHELRTPITPLKIYLQVLRRAMQGITPSAFPKIDILRTALDKTDHEFVRLERLIEDLLNVSRITAGLLTLRLEELDLSRLVRETVERHESEIRDSGCELRLQAETEVRGHWDRFRMEQVVENLLTNALKYGRGKPIDIAVEERGKRARLVVRDYGVGIARADQDIIFERFERLAPIEHYGGLGLGLYISREFVAAQGGTISVESSPGHGSTFVVELPL